ncbi:MAG: hypothetical protein IJ635_03390 [Bacteroidaceae bacterium]|nr:hypothetical protein [Bacteroidaceae bacterium]
MNTYKGQRKVTTTTEESWETDKLQENKQPREKNAGAKAILGEIGKIFFGAAQAVLAAGIFAWLQGVVTEQPSTPMCIVIIITIILFLAGAMFNYYSRSVSSC